MEIDELVFNKIQNSVNDQFQNIHSEMSDKEIRKITIFVQILILLTTSEKFTGYGYSHTAPWMNRNVSELAFIENFCALLGQSSHTTMKVESRPDE